jgi:hypothetical protein
MIWARQGACMVAIIKNKILSGESEEKRPFGRTR